MAKTYVAGVVTAYGAAVEAGYTGTYEEFCEEQAKFAENAQQVAEDRQAVEAAAATFTEETVPAAQAAITAEGTAQVEAVGNEGETQRGLIQTAGEGAVASVQAEGTTQIGLVEAEGADQVTGITAAGNTQVGNVNTAGSTQIAAVQAKGDEVIDSIPSDYTELTEEVGDLKSAMNDLYDNKIETIMTNGYCIQNLTTAPQEDAGSSCTNFIQVIPNRKYRLYDVYLSGSRAVNWYYQNQILGGTLVYGTNDSSVLIEIPSSARLIRATGRNGAPVEIHIVDDIETKIEETNKRITQSINNVWDVLNPISKNQKSEFLGLKEYVFPDAFNMESQVRVFTDGIKYITDFDAEDYKNTGSGTWYVAQNGSGNGTSFDNAMSFDAAIAAASNGDTIFVKDGVYNRDNSGYTFASTIRKSLNIIAENEAILIDGNFVTYSKVDGYTSVYKATRSLTKRVIDCSVSGKYIPYIQVESISAVESTSGSFFISENDVYVHTLKNDNPTGYVVNCLNYEKTLDIDNSNGSIKVYVENITVVGKYSGILINKANTSNSLNVCFNNVKTILCGNVTDEKDSFMAYGGNIVFNNCKALSSYKDGFNYSGRNSAETVCDCKVIEIDCIGAGCGHEASSAVMNGTTGHQGAKIIRINGKYYDCKGASVCDVQANTQSVNIGCMAYSPYDAGGYSQNFSIQQDGTEMWLEGCLSAGALYDVFCGGESTIHANNTAYETKSIYQAGTFVETNKQSVMGLALKRGLLFSIP